MHELNFPFNTYYQDGKPEAVKPVEINYTTNAGRGTIKMDMARVFPATAHDIKTIIDTLWMSADPYEIAGTICDYIKSVVADLQEVRPDEAYTADDKKYNAKITGFIKRYIANLDKIAGAFGLETVADEKAQAQTMKKCEVVCYECHNGQQVALSYSGYSFEKAGYTFQVTKKKYKNLYTVIVPCLGLSCAEYNGTLKEAPEHITENIINMLNRWTINEWGPAREKFVKVCADTLEYFTVPDLPERVKAETEPEQTAENTPAPALDAKSETRPAANQETRTAEKPARKEEKPARNVIKRDSAMIIGSWKQETTAGAPGDKFVIVKIDGSGLVGYNLRTLKTYSFFASNLRNADFFEIEAQYSGKPYDYETGYNMIDGWIERAKENRREARAERAQVWKPCIMSPLRKYGIIYRDIMGATDRQKPASADRVKAVLRLPKMQGCINIGWTAEKPATGAERSHNTKRAPAIHPPKRYGEKAGNRQEVPQALPTPQVTVRGSPQNQGEKIIENMFFQTENFSKIV